MIINAKDAILGRLSSYAAKQVLLGNKVDIVNCEECIVSGKKAAILRNYIRRVDRKAPGKGPYLYRRADMFVKRTIRGMLPYKQERGIKAFKRIKCFMGVPESYAKQKLETVTGADASRLKTLNFITINDLSKHVGKGVA